MRFHCLLAVGQFFFHIYRQNNNKNVKSTQYKKLVPNALWFTDYNLKSCKPQEKNKKKHQNDKSIGEKLKTPNFEKIDKGRVWCYLFHFFDVICKMSKGYLSNVLVITLLPQFFIY